MCVTAPHTITFENGAGLKTDDIKHRIKHRVLRREQSEIFGHASHGRNNKKFLEELNNYLVNEIIYLTFNTIFIGLVFFIFYMAMA